jgi:hypothetical protein
MRRGDHEIDASISPDAGGPSARQQLANILGGEEP